MSYLIGLNPLWLKERSAPTPKVYAVIFFYLTATNWLTEDTKVLAHTCNLYDRVAFF